MSTREHSIKAVISHPIGISLSTEIEDSTKKAVFYNKKVGSNIKGEELGYPNHTFKIKGGSDLAGFPHKKGIRGEGLKRTLQKTSTTSGPRRKKVSKRTGGQKLIDLRNVRLKKRVRGERLSEWTRQVNLVIMEEEERLEDRSIEEILADDILQPIAEKIGHIVLRWGLNGVKITANDTESSLKEEIQALGVSDSELKKIKGQIGETLLKLENSKDLFNKVQKIKKSHPPILGVKIANTIIEFYNLLKEDQLEEDPVDFLPQKIIDILKAADEGKTLKVEDDFSFILREE